jgi:hypothetical protein
MSVDTAHTIRASSAAVVIVTTMKNVIIIAPQHTREGQLAAMSKSLARTNKSQGPGQCDSARQQVGAVALPVFDTSGKSPLSPKARDVAL